MPSSDSNPLVSVIIPTRNRIAKLTRCVDSVSESLYPRIEVVVVDDASDEPVQPRLSEISPRTIVIRNQKRQFLSCSRNTGAASSRGDYLFFLDDDNVVAPDAIGELVSTLQRFEIAAVASPLIFYLNEPTRVWTSYIVRSRLPGFYKLRKEVPEDEVDTFSFHNSFMVKRKAFDELGGFDCVNFPIRFSEVDFAHRLHARGYLARANPRSRVWHDLGWALVNIDSARAYYTERNRMIVLKRYFPKRDFVFYAFCILPFVGVYYLLHHPLSSSDGRLRTARSFLRGVVDGLTFSEGRSG